MKLLPAALALSCAALIAGCGRPGAGTSDSDQQTQERIEAEEAYQLSQLHEREAALDERERLLAQREQQSTPVAVPAPEPPAAAQEAEQPAPPASTPIPVTASSPPVPTPDATYQSFYDALSPYGSWVRIPGYDGYLWQPSAAVRTPSWRPYTVGHWVYTDEGWTWVSDEPFGWITYHYGRWMRTRTLGWVWMPGDQWAPAWVSWRYGDDYVGWAPLPPEAQFNGATGIQQWADDQYGLGPSDYSFVPAAAFGDDDMAANQAPPDQTEAIYDDSNNITNIYYDTGASAIICYGPNYDFMRSKSHRPLPPPYTLRRGGFRPGGNNGTIVSGRTIAVAAPRIVRKGTAGAPHTVRGMVVDTRVVAPPRAPAAPGGGTIPVSPPLHHPPASVRMAPQTNPAPLPRAAAGVAAQPARPTQSGGGSSGIPVGVPNPPAANPAPPPSNTDAQERRDLEILQQQQAARERQVAEAARVAAEKQSAAEAARAQRAEAEAAAEKAAREQGAAHQAQVSHPAQPASIPAGTQAPGRSQQ
jgi:hypothetical protein